jgi:hypothetical protein
MRVGILADNLPTALNIYHEVNPIPGCLVLILVCNTQKKSLFVYLLRQIFAWIKCNHRWRIVKIIFTKKVIFFGKELDHPNTILKLKGLNLDIGLHKAGTIYREATINSFKLGILNSHIGILPEYRGRSVMEWSILNGDPTGVTVFFIDSGIDTGEKIVLQQKIDVSHCTTIQQAKKMLFDSDAKLYKQAIEIVCAREFSYKNNDGSGQRYYVMSDLFQSIVAGILAKK